MSVWIVVLGSCASATLWATAPIVEIVTPDGRVTTVPIGNGRWGVPAGTVGSQSTPKVVSPGRRSVTLKIGDPNNPQWETGSVDVNNAIPFTIVPSNSPVSVLCFGCGSASPSLSVLGSSNWSLNVPRLLIARVSLYVDPTDPQTVFDDSNSKSVEVWFVRGTASSGNRPPNVTAGEDQFVAPEQNVQLQATATDPDGDPMTFSWMHTNSTGGSGIDIVGDNARVASFTAPGQETTLTFSFTASDGQLSSSDTMRVIVSQDDGGGDPGQLEILCDDTGNQAAVANGGPDRVVAAGEAINITGTATDPDNTTAVIGGIPVTGVARLAWEVLDGKGLDITLQQNSATVSFSAPVVSATTTIVLGFSAFDGRDCGSRDPVNVTIVHGNQDPTADAGEDRSASSGETIALSGSGSDPDEDPLTYSWSQIAGPQVQINDPNAASATFEAPEVEEAAELAFRLTVSDGQGGSATDEVTITVQEMVTLLNSVVGPVSLEGVGNLHFMNTFVGVALVDVGGTLNEIIVSAKNPDGVETENVPLDPPLQSRGQKAFQTGEILDLESGAVSLAAAGSQGPIQGFFMVGDWDLTKVDGIGGELKAASTLYFPIIQNDETGATMLFLHNPGEEAVEVTLKLFDPQGELLKEVAVTLATAGSLVETCESIFGEEFQLSEAFVEATTADQIMGFEFVAHEQDFMSLTGQVGIQTWNLWVPHVFFDGFGGTTLIRLLNVGQNKAFATLHGFDDNSQSLGTAEFEVEPNQLFVADLKDLLGINTDDLEEFKVISGHLKLDIIGGKVGVFQTAATLVGTVTFTGNNGSFRSTLPMVANGRKESIFPQVAQSLTANIFTGFAALNVGVQPAQVTAKVYDDMGNLTGETTFEVLPGYRVVDLLDGPNFMGSGFEQIRGHIRFSSTESMVIFALFGDYSSTFLAAIEGQAPLL